MNRFIWFQFYIHVDQQFPARKLKENTIKWNCSHFSESNFRIRDSQFFIRSTYLVPSAVNSAAPEWVMIFAAGWITAVSVGLKFISNKPSGSRFPSLIVHQCFQPPRHLRPRMKTPNLIKKSTKALSDLVHSNRKHSYTERIIFHEK